MKYDFETLSPRFHMGSNKWNEMLDYGVKESDDIIPFTVADMEIKNAPQIVDALKKDIEDHVLGYIRPTPEYFEAVTDWMKRRHNWDARPEWIVNTHGVVEAFFSAVRLFTKEGDGVILMTPIYYPMYTAVTINKRKLIKNPLICRDNCYRIDFEDLERKASDPSNTMLILCNPHNPTGRSFTREELERISEICLRNKVLVIADEIHHDLIMPGFKHTVYASISEEAKENCMVLTAPSKTFNLAGMQTSNIFIPNEQMRMAFIEDQKRIFNAPKVSMLGYTACKAAYNECEDWLEELLIVINRNREIIESFMGENFPQVKVYPLEGTYLLWLDFNGFGLCAEKLEEINRKEAGLFFDEGTMFGPEGAGFERWNLACPTRYITMALERMKKAYAAYV